MADKAQTWVYTEDYVAESDALTAHANTPDPRAPSTPIHHVDHALCPATSSMPQPIAR